MPTWATDSHHPRQSLRPQNSAVREFLQQHPRVRFHFTPTYSSWLNQVEIWFAKIEREVIARGIFTSVSDLARKLRRYINAYSANARPIQWKYSDPTRRVRSNELTATGHQGHPFFLLPVRTDTDGPGNIHPSANPREEAAYNLMGEVPYDKGEEDCGSGASAARIQGSLPSFASCGFTSSGRDTLNPPRVSPGCARPAGLGLRRRTRLAWPLRSEAA